MASTQPISAKPIWYVYGIVPSDSAVASAPRGIDDAEVAVEAHSAHGPAALVSVLQEPDYDPAAIESRSGDVEWLSPRAIAHDRVLTWASDEGAVVPLPMFSIFSSRDAVHTMLRDREPQLLSALERVGRGREYALRVYRLDAELMATIATLSPRLETMAATAAAASPGQRYLLERKLESEKKLEVRAVTQRIVDDIVARLSACAVQVVRSSIPRVADAEATRGAMVLNAAFLVSASALTRFRETLTTLISERGAQGFRFDFTGPWPPYHFVSEPSDDA